MYILIIRYSHFRTWGSMRYTYARDIATTACADRHGNYCVATKSTCARKNVIGLENHFLAAAKLPGKRSGNFEYESNARERASNLSVTFCPTLQRDSSERLL